MSQPRRGFSLIQLLVIIAILAILMGLLVPALQKVRESAARSQLMNNMKQVGLAMHSYHGNFAKFPPANDAANEKFVTTMSVFLLPYIEQITIYEKAVDNAKAPTNVTILSYNSPLDSSGGDFVRVQNFPCNVRVFTDGGFETAWDKVVALKSPMPCTKRINQITDGTSNTVGFATRYAASGTPSVKGGAEKPCGYYDLPLANDGGAFFGATPMAKSPPTATSTSGWQVMPTLAQVNCASALGLAHSFTARGIEAGFLDGSVRSVSPSLSANNWNALLAPNDGNEIGPD